MRARATCLLDETGTARKVPWASASQRVVVIWHDGTTHRVADGRFDEPVAVTSEDEFGALAASFNRMSAELGHQFRVQGALQGVHQAALAGEGAGTLLRAIFDQAETLIPGAGLAIALARPDDPFWWRVSDFVWKKTSSSGPDTPPVN